MSEILKSRVDEMKENPQEQYLKNAYIVGDSLSVGMTTGVKVEKKAVATGKQTNWMLDAVRSDIATLKSKKVMFLLGGTNDIFANKNASEIIENIDKIAEIAKQNGVKVVVGTIPPFTEKTPFVQNALKKMGSTAQNRFEELEKVNDYIRSKYDFIDYHALLRSPNNLRQLNPELEGKGSAKDGVHPFGAYTLMRQAQIEKMAQILEKNREKANEDSKIAELQGIIKNREHSMNVFRTTIQAVFAGQEVTDEQKQMTAQILEKNQSLLADMKKILTEVQGTTNELKMKNRELSAYENSSENRENFPEILDKISDLEKRVLEIDEQQTIFLKNFRLLHDGIRLNEKLSTKEIEKLRKMDAMTFLQMSREKRLQALTVGNIPPVKILDGSVKMVEINFSFGGRFNRQLYRAVTAGMIFPAEVRSVVVAGEKYTRQNLEGEFFSEQGKRLVIRDETRVIIEKIAPTAQLQSAFISKIDVKKYPNPIDLEIVTEAEKRGISEEFALNLFRDELKKISNEKIRRATMEDLFSDIDRQKGFFYKKTQKSAMRENGEFSPEFICYMARGNRDIFRIATEKMGYKPEEIGETTDKKISRNYSEVDTKILSQNITPAEIERLRSIRRFQPNSADTVSLFLVAAKMAWLPESWAKNEKLHYILGRESNGKVGVLNYTIKGMDLDDFYARANSSTKTNPIGATSTASGLGQLLLSNVDKYYPNGRKGIGDPINEAVGFMRYIADRYGNPDVAYQMYGRTGSYVHPTKWPQTKWFREWY